MKLLNSSSKAYYICMFFIVALLMAWAFEIYPLVADDLAFLGFWKQHDDGNFTLQGWVEFVKYIRLTDNSRLCNLLAPVWAVYLPKWFSVFAAGVIVAWSMMLMARMIMPKRDVGVFALVFLLSILLLPWRDNLMSNDYCLNYVYAAWLSLVVIKYLSAPNDLPESRGGRVILLVGSFLFGAWTEVFAVPVLCGLGCLALHRSFRQQAFWWWCFCAILIGVLIFGVSSGSVNRGENQLFVLPDEYKWRLVAREPSVVVLILFCAGGLIVRKGRLWLKGVFSSPLMIVMGVSMLVAVAMTCVIRTGPRASYWPIIASIVIWGRISQPYLRRCFFSAWGRRCAVLIFICGCLLVLLQYPAEYAFQMQSREVMTALQSKDERVAVELKDFELIPRWKALFIPREMWTTQLQRGCMEEFEPTKSVECIGDTMIISKVKP